MEDTESLWCILKNICRRHGLRLARELEEVLLRPREKPADYAELVAIGEAAYRQMVTWFGEPLDAERGCEIRQGYQKDISYCAHNRLLKRYIISLGRDFIDPLERKSTLAHEMYHRVTLQRKGLRLELWADEMLAYLATRNFMREQGLGKGYTEREITLSKQSSRMNAASLRKLERKTISLGSKERHYPRGFLAGVICLGAALTTIVKWEHICQMIEAESLEAWIAILPEKAHYPVRTLLELPGGENLLGEDAKAYDRFGKALFRKGDFKAAVTMLNTALRIEPYNAEFYRFLGIIHHTANQNSAAIDAYQASLRIEPIHSGSCFMLASLYHLQKQNETALDWITKAVHYRPYNQAMQVLQGLLLEECGRGTEARKVWEDAILLDPHSSEAKNARKALQEQEEQAGSYIRKGEIA